MAFTDGMTKIEVRIYRGSLKLWMIVYLAWMLYSFVNS